LAGLFAGFPYLVHAEYPLESLEGLVETDTPFISSSSAGGAEAIAMVSDVQAKR
jgi:hypothetical protein